MKLKAITFGFSDAPLGSESVKVTRRLYSPSSGAFGSSSSQQVNLTGGTADVEFTGLDGAYSFTAWWVDGSGALTPIGTTVSPANL